MPPIRNRASTSLNLWVYFCIFLAVIVILAWPTYSVWTRIVLFPLGLFFLTYIGWKRNPSHISEKSDLFHQDFLSSPGILGLFLILMAAVFFRSYHLVTLQTWPLWDDADLGSYAIRLSEKWDWRLSFGPQRLTPFFTCLQGCFFKLFQPSRWTLWLYPALWSLSVVPAAYAASRQFASRSFSVLFTLFLGLSFTAIYWGRFCLGGGLSLFWQLFLLGTLGWTLKGTVRQKPIRALVLGLCCAIALYISFLLLITCLVVVVIFIRSCSPKGRLWTKPLFLFLAGSVVPALPMFFWVFPGIVRGHLAAHLLGNGGPPSWLHSYATFFSY